MPLLRRRADNLYAAKDLPDCPGPRLHPFSTRNNSIEWLERLDGIDGGGNDGYVFKVRIDSKLYALKVFKFYSPLQDIHFWRPILGETFPLNTIASHMDPFFAECRAYAKLQLSRKRRGQNTRELAVPCFGYLFLSRKDRQALQDRGIDLAEDGGDWLPSQRKGSSRPVRALVKGLGTSDSGIKQNALSRILKNIHQMNKLGVYNRDIRSDNFRDGLLVDFGSSWTEPHCILDALSPKEALIWKDDDLGMFDNMVADENLTPTVRGLPDDLYCMKLRSWATKY